MNVIEDSASVRQTPAVTINDVTLTPAEVGGQRVITLAMIDRVHGRPDGTARKRFNDNRARLVEGKHFSKMSASAFRTRFPGLIAERATEDVTLMTERGYLILVKSFTDDLAWEVQDRLVESYFTTPKAIARPAIGPRMDVSREHRLMMREQVRWAKMAGLAGNQALLAANRATVKLTGIDNLGLLGVAHLEAPQNTALLTPSEIGERTAIGSGQAVNNRLCALGLQVQFRGRRRKVYYEPTEAGIGAGAVMVDVGKKDGAGVPIRQLRWSSAIVRYLEDANARHH